VNVHPFTSVLICAAIAQGLPVSAAAESAESAASIGVAGITLDGAWYLTIHYRDEASADPDADRWDDRLWLFEKRGSRMHWTEYPIVVFENREGRFESTDEQRTMRTLQFWAPNEEQLAQIDRGLSVNPRGARSKGLRGSVHKGYRSAGGLRSESASVIGYAESWSVEGLPEAPVFTQAVSMGSTRTEDLTGRTRYRATSVSSNGREVRGSFERDGTRHGSFVLRRAGEPVLLGARSGRKMGGPGSS
jgi:hypothetical protein